MKMKSANLKTLPTKFVRAATFFAILGVLTHVAPDILATESAVVLKDRVNLRARPTTKAEVVGQVNRGDTLDVFEHTMAEGEEWVRVALPATASAYVNAAHVKDGVVTADTLNVRSGTSTKHAVLAKLKKGDHVDVIDARGEWLKIHPPAGASAWVAARLVQISAPPVVETLVPLEVQPLPQPEREAVTQTVVRIGVLQRATDGAAQGALYELRTPEVEYRSHRMCFVDTEGANLERFVGKKIRIQGTERWERGQRYPVVVVKRVSPIY
jgi:SH3-like domain-containing protein